MPNWCSNNLEMVGPKNVIEEIAESKLSLQKLFPCPAELLGATAPAEFNDKEKAAENVKKYGYPDWYSWQIANWGTKWDIGPVDVEMCENEGEYSFIASFDSAWSPPVDAMKKLHEKYKDKGLKIRMEYFEPGCAFLGVCKTVGDKFVDEYAEYKNADELEECVEELGCELAAYEVEYLRESEEEEKSYNKKKPVKAEGGKKPAKKPVKKEKNPVKTEKKKEKKKEKKPAKKPAKKPVKKTEKKKSVKKPAKKDKVQAKKPAKKPAKKGK